MFQSNAALVSSLKLRFQDTWIHTLVFLWQSKQVFYVFLFDFISVFRNRRFYPCCRTKAVTSLTLPWTPECCFTALSLSINTFHIFLLKFVASKLLSGLQVSTDVFLQLGHGVVLSVADVAAQWQLQQLAGAIFHTHSPLSLQHRDHICSTNIRTESAFSSVAVNRMNSQMQQEGISSFSHRCTGTSCCHLYLLLIT